MSADVVGVPIRGIDGHNINGICGNMGYVLLGMVHVQRQDVRYRSKALVCGGR